MTSPQQHATAQGFDRKWALFFLTVMALVVGAFVVQRFVFAPAGVETRGEHGSGQEDPARP